MECAAWRSKKLAANYTCRAQRMADTCALLIKLIEG